MLDSPPPTLEELHAWGWEQGIEVGRCLANECDATVGGTFLSLDAPFALAITSEQLRLHGNPDAQAESER